MAGDSMEKKCLSHVLWLLRKLRNVLDARASDMDFKG